MASLTVSDRLQTLAPAIQAASAKWNVSIPLIQAIITQESGGNVGMMNLLEPKGGASYGVMEIQLPTAQWMRPGITVDALMWPDTNIDIGTQYLAYLLKQAGGNVYLAIQWYNAGPGNSSPLYVKSAYALYLQYGGTDQAALGASLVQSFLNPPVFDYSSQQASYGELVVLATQQAAATGGDFQEILGQMLDQQAMGQQIVADPNVYSSDSSTPPDSTAVTSDTYTYLGIAAAVVGLIFVARR